MSFLFNGSFSQLTDYLSSDWIGTLELGYNLETYKAISMNEMDVNLQGETEKKQLSISVHVDKSQSMDLHVYSPYWIINKTGLPLQLRVSDWYFLLMAPRN